MKMRLLIILFADVIICALLGLLTAQMEPLKAPCGASAVAMTIVSQAK